MALDTTLAGERSDSFVAVAEADTYFSGHYDTTKGVAWAALSTAHKEMMLRQATATINSFNFWSSKHAMVLTGAYNVRVYPTTPYSDVQALQFPRNVDIDTSDSPYIPDDIKWATCEQALYMKTSLNTDAINARAAGLIRERVKADVVEVEQQYAEPGKASVAEAYLSPIAKLLISKYIVNNNRWSRA